MRLSMILVTLTAILFLSTATSISATAAAPTPTATPTGKPVIATPVPVFDNADWTLVELETSPGLYTFADTDVRHKFLSDAGNLLGIVFTAKVADRFTERAWAKDIDKRSADYYFSLRKYNTDGTITITIPKKVQVTVYCFNVAHCYNRYYTFTTPGAVISTYDKNAKLIREVKDDNWKGGFFADFVWDGKAWKVWALEDLVMVEPAPTPTAK